MARSSTSRFRTDEDGAITVDWVVLTAALVGLGLAGIASVAGGAKTVSCNASDKMVNLGPKNTFETSLGQSSGTC